jgi:phosphohistidine phosphatase
MKLYLLQHGDALPDEVNPERPLSEHGRNDVIRLAEFVGKNDIRVQRVHHSGKTRARETAEIVAARMASGVKIEATTGLNPNDPVEPWAKQINNWQEDTLLVGHMPFMGRLAAYLLSGNSSSQFVAFEPGSMLCLDRDESGHWAIAWMLRPELLSIAKE